MKLMVFEKFVLWLNKRFNDFKSVCAFCLYLDDLRSVVEELLKI